MTTSPPSSTDPRAPWCLEDRWVHAAVEARLFGTSSIPVSLGRYVIQRPLGAGGMGRLFLAEDRELGRKVALKLVAPHLVADETARRRILAEGRSMARLSHPNVAQVYEVGQDAGQLYVAMEFVDGQDLRDWLREHAPSRSEILDVFLQAGEGLAAAHDEGLVHRDFKPANVVLEAGGRPRVIDFGLATEVRDTARSTRLESAGPVDERLTQTGAVVGTPAYMAPEQWSGGLVDARSDQFAYCVALYEALSGSHPYGTPPAHDLPRSIERPQLRPLRGVSYPVVRALRRGIEIDPDARWPNMPSLLRALDPTRRSRRRRFSVVGATGLVLALLAARTREDPCAHAADPIRAIWDETTAQTLHARGRDPGPAWVPTTVSRLTTALDVYAKRWGDAAVSACADPSASAGARACLAWARDDLRRRLEEFDEGDPTMLVDAVGRLELAIDPKSCLERSSASDDLGSVPPTELVEAQRQVDRALGDLASPAEGRGFANTVAAGRDAGTRALAAADAFGSLPWMARAHWSMGHLLQREGESVEAEAMLRRALELGHRLGWASLSAAASIDLVYAISRNRDRAAEARTLADEAGAMIEQLGNPPILRARLHAHRASAIAHARDGDPTAAVEEHARALELLERTLGPRHPAVVTASGNLGSALNYAGRADLARDRLSATITSAELIWGPRHPRTGQLRGTLGLSHLRLGNLRAAEAESRQALEIAVEALGDAHVQADNARYNLASVLRRQERHVEAASLLTAGLTHRRDALGVGASSLTPWHVALGESELALDHLAIARTELEAAIASFERDGATATDYARVRLALARAWAVEAPWRARAWAEQARRSAEDAGATHWQRAATTLLEQLSSGTVD